MRKQKFIFAAIAAIGAVFAEGATSVTQREATNIVKAVAYTKSEADGKFIPLVNGYTRAEVDAALAGKLDRIVFDARWINNHSEFKQTLDGLEYIEYQTEDGQTEVISRASFGNKMVYVTEDANWLTAGIHASEDYLGFGISQSASAFKNGSFSIFYGNGFIDIGDNEIEIPNATGTMALRSTTLAGYGIGDAYTKTQTDQRISELAPPFELTGSLVYSKITGLSTTMKSSLFGSLLNAYGDGFLRNAPQVAQGVDGLFLVSGEGESFDSSGGGIGGSFILYGENGGTTSGRTVSSIGGGTVLPGTRPGTGGRTGGDVVSTSEVSRVYLAFGMSGPDVPGLFPGQIYTDAIWRFGGDVAFLPDNVHLLDEGTMTDMTLAQWVVEGIEATMTPAKLVSLVQAMTAAQKTAFKTALGIQ